jgi:hypothetical protein
MIDAALAQPVRSRPFQEAELASVVDQALRIGVLEVNANRQPEFLHS